MAESPRGPQGRVGGNASPFRRSVTGRVSVVAHRGLSAEAPENTMASFRRAAEVSCDLLEFDVHLSKDGVLVVIHDDTLERTTNGRGLVREHTWAELSRLDAGAWFSARFAGERLPRFEELATWAKASGVVLSCEIKQPTPATGLAPYGGIERAVAEVLRANGLERRALVHSFDHPTIQRFGALLPEVTTAVSYGGGTFVEPLVLAKAAGASGIHPWWAWASPDTCAAAHAAGMHVHAWGTPEPAEAQVTATLVRAGVDSLDANDPRLLRAILAALA